jgi:hypothetical protein
LPRSAGCNGAIPAARFRIGRGADRRARGPARRRLAGARPRGRRPDGAEGAGRRSRGSRPCWRCRDVRLLWEVCQIPDFRDITPAEHAAMLRRIFGFLHEAGESPKTGLPQVRAVDRPQGDIDALSKRLAFIRTWTFVAQRRGWVRDETHWRGETRAVEDRLSDALHGALTQRFVDRRTSVLLRRLKQKEALVAEVSEIGRGNDRGPVRRAAGRIPVPPGRQRNARCRAHPAVGRHRRAGPAIQAARRSVVQRPRHRARFHRTGRPDVGF